jgi:hypothetical protein
MRLHLPCIDIKNMAEVRDAYGNGKCLRLILNSRVNDVLEQKHL